MCSLKKGFSGNTAFLGNIGRVRRGFGAGEAQSFPQDIDPDSLNFLIMNNFLEGEDAMSQAIADGTQVNNTVVRLLKEDITDLEVDAFVYYAQHDLAIGSGFGTAIATRGGPTVQKELDELGPLDTCDVVVSGAGNMKANFIVHAVGPRFQEDGIEPKLYETMVNTLKAVEEKGIERIAFPAMGAGYYGILPDVSAKVMMQAFKEHLSGETCIKEVVICVLDSPQFNSFKAPVEALGK